MMKKDEIPAILTRLRVMISQLDTTLLYWFHFKKVEKFTSQELDAIERQTLETRTSLALLTEELKRELGMEIYCPDREEEEIACMQAIATSRNLDPDPEEIREYFMQVFDKSKKAQEQQRRAAAKAVS